MTNPEHKPRPRLPRGKPFAHFRWNYGWGNWEQVIPEAAGRRGVVAAYAHPPAETSADDGAPARHTLSAPAEPKPEPQDEAIGGLIETWLAELKASAEMPDEGEFGKGSRYQLTALGLEARELSRQRLTALSRLQVERDELRKALTPLLLIAKSDADFRGAHPMRDAAIFHAEAALSRKTQRGPTSSQSQPCSETGPNSPSSPQTPFSDGGGES